MKLEIIKRFEFAAAHKYWEASLTEEENKLKYGKDSLGKYGHGHNFIVFLYFTGPVNPLTGMIMELSTVKALANKDVITPFDHRYLNDLEVFQTQLPTPEAIAKELLKKAVSVFKNTPLVPTACHVIETASHQAIAYSSSIHTLKSNKEKTQCIDYETQTLLSTKQPTPLGIWTESESKVTLTQSHTIHATHCLTNASLSEEEQENIFGKCQFVHGHEFDIDVTFECKTQRLKDTEALALREALSLSLEDWQYKSLNDEVSELENKLCTCENIIQVLLEKLSKISPYPICELVLKETPNNGFRLSNDT